MRDVRGWRLSAFLLGISVVLVLLGACVGSTGIENAFSAWSDPVAIQIVQGIRLPRTFGAWAAGALLGLAGAVAQALFRNPLADPYLLGSASGAALGVAWASALIGASPLATQWVFRLEMTGAAFTGAIVGVLLTLLLASGVQQTLRLLLAGVIVGVVLSAARDLVTLAKPDVLQTMQAFMLGSTAFVGWTAVNVMLLVLCPLLAVAVGFGQMLDGLGLGEPTATSLGVPLRLVSVAMVAVLALATGAAVAHTGLIAFVGLAAPHLARSLSPVPQGRLAILAALTGGVLLMAADIVARTVLAPQELPVGVLCAVFGGSYLLWRLHRQPVARGLFA